MYFHNSSRPYTFDYIFIFHQLKVYSMNLPFSRKLFYPAVALTGLILSFWCANRLFYYPDSKVYGNPKNHGLNYEDIWFESSDGTKLHGWFIPSTIEEVKGTIVHFHGNAQNLSSHFEFTGWLPPLGYNVFIFDYRGYGKSEGKAEKTGIKNDSIAALKYAMNSPQINHDNLIVVGQSLGGTNALAAIKEVRPENLKTVIIDSTFASYRKIVKDKLDSTFLSLISTPLSYILVNNSDSAEDTLTSIPEVPVLFVHDKHDRVIPSKHTEYLHSIAPEPKDLLLVDYGYHTSAFNRKESRAFILNWLNKYL